MGTWQDANSIVVELALCTPVKWRLARMLPREWRKCTLSAELILNPMTLSSALIIIGKALYKNWLLSSLLLLLLYKIVTSHSTSRNSPYV